MSLGDMPTDACMYPHSRIGIAMGQSPEIVRNAASHVVPSNREEGWALAIETHVLR
jgi:hydroxymethylpyrimidine pyrophosphatase-like HAD family hydrolase